MIENSDLFPDAPESFKRKCAMRRRSLASEQRAKKHAQTVYARELNVWLLTYQGSRESPRFHALKRAKEDILMTKAIQTGEQGARQIYKYLEHEPFDERVGYMRPVYALPHHSSITASHDPS